jgi:hypothetical protein
MMTNRRRIALFLTSAAVAWLLGFSLAQASEQAFRFAVIGDSRIAPLPDRSNQFEQPQMFLRTIREINLLDYDLVLDVGDLILGGTDRAEEIERMWDGFDAAWQGFEMPAKMIAGNHDIWDAQSDAVYRRRYGDPTYSFDMGGCHFIVLNSEDAPQDVNTIRGAQLAWLKADLEANREAAHTFVFLHKPLWTFTDDKSNWNAQVHPLLAQYGVEAVFAGHDHLYRECAPRDGVRYFITGGGGAEIGVGTAEGGFHHHMAVSVRGDDVRYAVVQTGSVLPTDVVSDRSAAAIQVLRDGFRRSAPYLSAIGQPITIEYVGRNERSEPLFGALEWQVPPHWTVTPRSAALRLAPGETAHVTFTAVVQDAAVTTAYPPERAVDVAQRCQGAVGEVGWRPLAAAADGYVDLRAAISPSDHVLAYAVTTVTAKRAAKTVLTLGSNDGAKVWVNGELVYSEHIGRAAKPHEEKIPVTLRQGANQVLLKVENWGSAWGFYAAIVDVDGVLSRGRP